MPVEHKPNNLDLSDITVIPKDTQWGVKQPDSNRIEIHHWKDKDEAIEALASEYVANMQPGTPEGKARELYAKYNRVKTNLDYNPKAVVPDRSFYNEMFAEWDAIAQERTQIEKDDPSFRTKYWAAREKADGLKSRFHKAFPSNSVKEAGANALALADAIGNKVNEVVNPKSQ
jgi:hypothetical protein